MVLSVERPGKIGHEADNAAGGPPSGFQMFGEQGLRALPHFG